MDHQNEDLILNLNTYFKLLITHYSLPSTMAKSYYLNAENLSSLPKDVSIPSYDRNLINTSILHIGVSNFHRSHQAYYIMN
jgi:mannitol 2-dehydrogenase